MYIEQTPYEYSAVSHRTYCNPYMRVQHIEKVSEISRHPIRIDIKK